MMIRNAIIAALLLATTVAVLGYQRAQGKAEAAQATAKALRDELQEADQRLTQAHADAERLQAAHAAQIERLEAIRRDQSARGKHLEKLQRDSKPIADWGATRLPDDIARLLDYRTDRADVVQQAGPVPAAEGRAKD